MDLFYGKSDGGNLGVGIAVKTDIVLTTHCAPIHINARLMRMRIPQLNKKKGTETALTVIVAHAPTDASDPEVKEAFWSALHYEVEKTSAKDDLYVLIDGNARLGKRLPDCDQAMKDIVGNFGRDILNDNGQRLLQLCSDTELAINNTFFLKGFTHTFEGPSRKNAAKSHWCIDYVLTRQRCRTTCSLDLNVIPCDESDHHPVRLTAIQGKSFQRFKQAARSHSGMYIDRCTVRQDRRVRTSTTRDVSYGLGALTDRPELLDVDILEEKINSGFADALRKNFGSRAPVVKKRTWWDDDVIQARLQPTRLDLNNAATALANHRNTAHIGDDKAHFDTETRLKKVRDRAKKAVKKLGRYTENEFWDKAVSELEESRREGNRFGQLHCYYKALKAVGIEPTRKIGVRHIRNEDGELLHNAEAIRDRFARHFQSLLNPDGAELDYDILELIDQLPIDEALSREPEIWETEKAIRKLKNWKACGPDGIPAEALKLALEETPEGQHILLHIHELVLAAWRREEVPQKWKDAIITVLFKKKDRNNCGNYRGISLVAHAGKAFLYIVTTRLNAYVESLGILPEEQCGFRPARSTTDMIFVARMLQEFGREKNTPIFMCFIDLMKAYDTINRRMLWRILARFGVPAKLIAVIRAFHDNMRACVRLDDGVESFWFLVMEGLRQGCVLAPLLFNIFFAAVLMIAAKKIEADELAQKGVINIISRLDVNPLKATASKARKAKTKRTMRALWSMLYADDAGVASLQQDSLSRMMTIIVETCTKFGLSVSEPKTKTLCFRTSNDADEGIVHEMRIEAAGQKYEQQDKFVYLGSLQTQDHDISPELSKRSSNSWFKMKRYSKSIFDAKKGIQLGIKTRMYKAEVLPTLLYGCETWTLGGPDMTLLQRIHHRQLLRLIGFRRKRGQYRTLSYKRALSKTKCESIATIIHKLRLKFAGRVARMDDARLPKFMLFGELNTGEKNAGRPEKTWRQCLRDSLKHFEIDAEQWHNFATEGEGEWTKRITEGAKKHMIRWHEREAAEAAKRHRDREAVRKDEDAAAADSGI